MPCVLSFIKRHLRFLRLIVLVVLFSILFYKVHPSEIIATCRDARPKYLILAVFIAAPKFALQLLRWKYILGTLEPKLSLKAVTVSLFGGFFLGALSPGRTGELARGMLIPGRSKLRIASLTAVEKGFNQFVVLFFGLLTLFFILPWPAGFIPAAGMLLLCAGLLSVYRLEPLWERMLSRFFDAETVENALAAFTALSPDRLIKTLGFSLAVYLVYTAQFYCVLLGFYDVTLTVAAKTLPLIYLVDLLLPVSIGDFGVRETASVTLLGYYGIGGGTALSASFTQNVLSFLLPAAAGGVMIMCSRARRS